MGQVHLDVHECCIDVGEWNDNEGTILWFCDEGYV